MFVTVSLVTLSYFVFVLLLVPSTFEIVLLCGIHPSSLCTGGLCYFILRLDAPLMKECEFFLFMYNKKNFEASLFQAGLMEFHRDGFYCSLLYFNYPALFNRDG